MPCRKRKSGVAICAGFLAFLAAAYYLLSCSSGSRSNTQTANPPPPTAGMDVTTYHNDVARTGQNLNESILTPGNVNASNFGKLFVMPVDGKVDAEPLYLGGVTIPGKRTHNVLYVVTEHGSVYAMDADTGTNLWQVSMLQPGETTSDNRGCSQITPEIGITATPVIDRKAGANGTIYVVAMSKDSSGGYHQRLHALDVTTGAEEFGGPQNIQSSFPGTGDNSSGGTVIFDPGQYAERAGLLLLNGVIYTSWTSHCDIRPYTGWMIGYDQNTLAQVAVLNVTPNGNEGAFWMSGTAPAADSSGNIYALDGNGVFDSTLNSSGFPSEGDFGNAFLKVSTANKQLAVADYFEMSNQSLENSTDGDLGSGGALVLPDLKNGSGQTVRLAVGAGKDGNIYVVNRDSMESSIQPRIIFTRSCREPCRVEPFPCLRTSTARFTTEVLGAAFRSLLLAMRSFPTCQPPGPAIPSPIPGPRRVFPRTEQAAQSCGQWKTVRTQYSTPTMRAILLTSFTTAIRHPGDAISSERETSSSHR